MRFSKDYSKLNQSTFTTIRKNTIAYVVGNIYTVKTPTQEFKVEVTHKQPLRKAGITEDLAVSDADCSRRELITMLEKWHGKKFDNFALLFLRREPIKINTEHPSFKEY